MERSPGDVQEVVVFVARQLHADEAPEARVAFGGLEKVQAEAGITLYLRPVLVELGDAGVVKRSVSALLAPAYLLRRIMGFTIDHAGGLQRRSAIRPALAGARPISLSRAARSRAV